MEHSKHKGKAAPPMMSGQNVSAMKIALDAKRRKVKASELRGPARTMYQQMSEEELVDAIAAHKAKGKKAE